MSAIDNNLTSKTTLFGKNLDVRLKLIPLYTSAPKREPLSRSDVARLWYDSASGNTEMVQGFARAIQRAHGIGVADGTH